MHGFIDAVSDCSATSGCGWGTSYLSDRTRSVRGQAFCRPLVLLGVIAIVGICSSTAPAYAQKLDLCRFQRSFTEDFNTLSVSSRGTNDSRWIAHTPWNGDFGDAAFA